MYSYEDRMKAVIGPVDQVGRRNAADGTDQAAHVVDDLAAAVASDGIVGGIDIHPILVDEGDGSCRTCGAESDCAAR